MGQEILYCSHCQCRLRSSDFDKGEALRVDHRPYCSRCIAELPSEISRKKIEQALKQAEGLKLLSKTPARATPGIPMLPPPKTSKILRAGETNNHGMTLILSFGALCAIIIGLLLWSSGGSSRPEPLPSKPGVAAAPKHNPAPVPAPAPLPPRVPALAPPPPAPPPVEPPPPPRAKPPELSKDAAQQAQAKEALRKAREARTANPRDFVANFDLAQKAAFAAEGMPWADEAAKELDLCRKQLTEFFDSELAMLDKEIRHSCEKEEFKKAFDAIEKAGTAHEGAQWSLAVSKRKREVGETTFKLFDTLQDKAREARQANANDEVKTISDRVARWGLPELMTRLQKALEADQ
jgi:hypothetical protein